MNTISELNIISKRGPQKLRFVTLYNLVSFWFALGIGLIGMLVGLYLLPAEQVELLPLSLLILIPVFLIALQYLMLRVNLKFLKGSKKAYWILVLFFALQCVGFGIAGNDFNFELSSIPLSFSFRTGESFIKINVAAIVLTVYLLSFSKDLPELLETLKAKNL